MTSVTLALAGNPNCGKTSLFNALTGSKQRIGNWPGVTVERKTGVFVEQGATVTVVDLPGAYSLTMVSEDGSVDERIACEYILTNKADIIINIVDASNLERNLYLTAQLLEMQVPIIVAVNMMDVARQRKINIDLKALAHQLGCPVVALECHRQKGIAALKAAILKHANKNKCQQKQPSYPEALTLAMTQLSQTIKQHLPEQTQNAHWLALRLLEDDVYASDQVNETIICAAQEKKQILEKELGEESDILIADRRYGFVNQLTQSVVTKGLSAKNSLTQVLDKVVLNRILGIPIFLVVMYLMFLFAVNISGAFQDFFDIGSNVIFVQGLSHLLLAIGAPAWFTGIIAVGIGKGISTTITFTPIIAGMFFFLSFLEDSGYMARAAFVMDRLMRAMGLPGKSFVPMIVGFGCNVPAIMASRTLENKRDRILTVVMSPFMSCGARLAIFAVFTAAFFPVGGQNVVFALYLVGIVVAVLTGLILRKTILKGEPAPLVMELPPYHIPRLRSVLRQTWNRVKAFLYKAGRFIIPICIIIGALNAININGTLSLNDASSYSLLSVIGQMLTPLFAPLGLQQTNWPATVGLFTGVLAKEVVIATLNSLYMQVGHIVVGSSTFDFWMGIHQAFASIPQNLSSLGSAFSNPILAGAPLHSVHQGVFGQMYQRFDGKIGAFAYLLFILLYIPCVSTTAAMVRELGRGWAVFSIFWNTSLAYGIAVIFYQLATLVQHPYSSTAWVLGIFIYFSLILVFLIQIAKSGVTKPTLAGTHFNKSQHLAKGATL